MYNLHLTSSHLRLIPFNNIDTCLHGQHRPPHCLKGHFKRLRPCAERMVVDVVGLWGGGGGGGGYGGMGDGVGLCVFSLVFLGTIVD